MIARLLIANRGEIACRIIAACRELGVESIAVYSDADAKARHVQLADRAIRIGPPPASQSYLNIPSLIEAARQSGADAVHPGYGFLSERAGFARACIDAGLIFVGPPPAALDLMGSKIAARRLMQKAGVPVVPGATPADQSNAALQEAANAIGYPILIKPSAGGGGIGMKIVREADDLPIAAGQARREAAAAFADETLFVERLIEQPRHVEIQVFADDHGHVVHLFERECSIQRRHQKMIEESPCPVLDSVVRSRMGDAAVAAARAAGYRNAGTVEFLLEGRGADARFYFLEMNARLQVEHPVTECVTGVDLVRAQLLVASGERLPWQQTDLMQRGHAIECRVYAEDPLQDFLPQAGVLALYREPNGPGIRIDSGVTQGTEVSVFYDPMLAKLIAMAENREAAIARAAAALRRFGIVGITTNIPFLLAILQHPRFVAGDLDTSFLSVESEALRSAVAASPAIAETTADVGPASRDPFDTLGDWRVSAAGHTRRAGVAQRADTKRKSRTAINDAMASPMPATVVKVLVREGASIKQGAVVVLLEAMKMELPIRAPRDGVVRAIRCAPGELVQAGVPLVELDS